MTITEREPQNPDTSGAAFTEPTGSGEPSGSSSVLSALASLLLDLGFPSHRAAEVDEFGMDEEFFRRGYEPLVSFFYDKYFRVEVEGAEWLPANGPSLIVANHAGCLPYDALMLKEALFRHHPRHVIGRGLAEKFVNRLPFVSMIGAKGGEVLACPENGDRLLQQGETVYVFPEGVKGIGKYIWNRYRLERYGRGGFVQLALRNRVPLIPVCIFGAEEANPIIYKSPLLQRITGFPFVPITPQLFLLGPLGVLPLPVKMKLRFLKPIELDPEECDFILDSDYRTMEFAEHLRTMMQESLTEMLQQRKNLFW